MSTPGFRAAARRASTKSGSTMLATLTPVNRGAHDDESGGRTIPHATGISLPGPVVRLRMPWVRGEEGPRTDSTYPIVRCSLYYKYIYNFRITITKALIE